MRKLIAGVASVALAAGAAYAQPDNRNGKGQEKGHGDHGPTMSRQSGPTIQPPAKGKGNGNDSKAERPERGAAPKAESPFNRGNDNKNGKASNRSNGRQGNGDANSDRASASPGDDRAERMVRDRGRDREDVRVAERDFERSGPRDIRRILYSYDEDRGLIEGCPPGLAKKRNGCMPPGQARKEDYRYAYYRPDYFGFDRLGDGRYYYDGGYLYRLGGNDSILGFLPLLGGALGIGKVWPSYYDRSPVPDYYQDYYNLGPAGNYAYANDVIYRLDPETAAITGIAAMLTGDEFVVGQPAPRGYDVYNVPYEYRDRYFDRPDAHYRYSDGYIYQIDPETRLIAAAIELLA